MAKLSDEIIKLIEEYKRKYGKKPEPFWYTEWNSQQEYAEYLKKEIEKNN
jgi:hypothetical protein